MVQDRIRAANVPVFATARYETERNVGGVFSGVAGEVLLCGAKDEQVGGGTDFRVVRQRREVWSRGE